MLLDREINKLLPEWKSHRHGRERVRSMQEFPTWQRGAELGVRDMSKSAGVGRDADALQARLDEAERQLMQVLPLLHKLMASRVAMEEQSTLSSGQTQLLLKLNEIHSRGLDDVLALSEDIKHYWQEFLDWIDKVMKLFSPQVVIVTQLESDRSAQALTFVGSSGDFCSVFAPVDDRRLFEQHSADVTQALEERAQALRSVSMVLGYAIQLAEMILLPGMAIPKIIVAVWKFVQDFLSR